MVKVIVHIAKVMVAVVLTLLCISCGFDFKSIDGDGNVSTQKRQLTGTFNSVTVDRGLEVIIQQGTEQSVTVEADQNLHEHIKTEIKGNELKITADTNIGNGTKTITVVLPVITSLSTSSSATIKNQSPIQSDDLTLSSSSGSSIQLNVHVKKLDCDTSSGAHVEIAGQAEKIEVNASSGAHVDAKGLKAVNAEAEVSSGGEVTVNPTEHLSADASSGGHIYYVNTPSKLKKNVSSGGTVSQK